MNSLSDLITLAQVESFQNAIANFAGEQESAIIDFAILLQMKRHGDSKENYTYEPYMFSGEYLKSFKWLNEENKEQFMYYFMVDYIHPTTKKPYTVCIKLFGYSAFNTQMQKAAIGDNLTIKFVGLKPNPKPKAKPFLSCYVSGFKTPAAVPTTTTVFADKEFLDAANEDLKKEPIILEAVEKKNSDESGADDLPF